MLKELLPRLQRFGVLWQAGNPYYRAARGQFEQVCQSLGLVPIIVEIGAAGEIDAAIGHLVRQRAQAVVMPSNDIVNEHGDKIVDAATKHRLPTMSDETEAVREFGALIA